MIDFLATHSSVHLFRQVGFVLGGLTLGLSLVAFFRYLYHVKLSKDLSERKIMRASAGVAFVFGLGALFIGVSSGFAHMEDRPFNWRDLVAFIWLINAVAVMAYLLLNEKYWWGRKKT